MMGKIRVVFCGEKPLGVRCLDLLRSWRGVEIVAACTRAKAETWWGPQVFRPYCTENRIPLCRRSALRQLPYDLLVSVLYPFVIEGEHIARARNEAVNLHEAPLPRWRGCNGYAHAILAGDRRYGTTLHELVPVLDAGRTIASRSFSILPNETVKELYHRTTEESFGLFRESMRRVLCGKHTFVGAAPNEESFLNARNSLDALKPLAPEMPLAEVYRRARAFDFVPWEPAYWDVGRSRYYFFIGDSPDRHREAVAQLPRRTGRAVLGEMSLTTTECSLIDGFDRPLVVCCEESYRRQYPTA
jgi:methionyl-tRNA formyltransferase